MPKYQDVVVGASAYTTAPSATAGFEPHFHRYTPIGPSAPDVYFSWDGQRDHGRLPLGAVGAIAPQIYDVSYKAVWLRSTNGVTGTIGVGFYTRQ